MYLLAFLLAVASTNSAHVVEAPKAPDSGVLGRDKCSNATNHFAGKTSVYRGEPATPQKLTELPEGQTYAAVYRVVNGCAVPVLYREVHEVRPSK